MVGHGGLPSFTTSRTGSFWDITIGSVRPRPRASPAAGTDLFVHEPEARDRVLLDVAALEVDRRLLIRAPELGLVGVVRVVGVLALSARDGVERTRPARRHLDHETLRRAAA